ncbi:MAG: response regulator transcription factor [Paludibacter sp.]|jgi:DNA-binding NarL/FixJ family response regulator|nr:response regulator transcription factor [Paludibacter sp.]
MDATLKIAIAEPSVIVRSGVASALKRITGYHVQTFEITAFGQIANYIKIHKPDILVVNPVFWGNIDINKIKQESEQAKLKIVALTTNMIDENIINNFDGNFTLFDTIESLSDKILHLFSKSEITIDTKILSQREKEILACLVKGMTNKEIAQTLFLSPHTVITHRRNITTKLEIHSTAGLTVYAIVNKIIELDDLKGGM